MTELNDLLKRNKRKLVGIRKGIQANADEMPEGPERRAYIKAELERWERELSRTKAAFAADLKSKPRDLWPLVWQLNNKGVKKAFDRAERMADMRNYCWDKTRSREGTINLADKVKKGCAYIEVEVKSGKDKGKIKRRELVLFEADPEKDAKDLGMSVSTYRQYLKAMDEAGIIRKVGRIGSQGHNVYAIGYWTEHGRQPFVTNTKEWKQKLADFKVWPTKEK